MLYARCEEEIMIVEESNRHLHFWETIQHENILYVALFACQGEKNENIHVVTENLALQTKNQHQFWDDDKSISN